MTSGCVAPQAELLSPAERPRDSSAQRIVGLDVARALAVFGMFGAHVGAVADDVGWSPSSWLAVVNGRSSILFAVLAGVSLALLSGRTEPVRGDDLVRARTRILVRAAWVFALGGALEALGTDVDIILGVYAVLFVLALPFLRWRPRQLLLAAGALAVLAPASDVLLAQFVGATGASDAPFVSLAVTGAYPALIWWTFILVGLAVGRCDLGAAEVRTRLAIAGAGLAVLGYGGGWLTTQWWEDGHSSLGPLDGVQESGAWSLASLSGAAPHSGTTMEIAGSTGVALVVIAVCLVVAGRLPTLTLPLAAVGAMALTAYVGSVVAIWATGIPDSDSNLPWGVYVLVTLGLAVAWRFTFGRGPLERLLTWSSVRAAR